MKTRTGFVSNSSSSSFIVASPKKLTVDGIMRVFGYEDSPLRWMIKGFAKFIAESSERITSLDEWMKNRYLDEAPKTLVRLMKQYPYVYELQVANDDDSVMSHYMYDEGCDFKIEHPQLVVLPWGDE